MHQPTRRLDRPVFIVSPPRAGSSLLFETLARSPGAYTIGGESHQVIESIPSLHPSAHGWASNRLLAEHADTTVVRELEESFIARSRDRDGVRPNGLAPLRLLEKTPKNSLRVPFLARAFPDALFVYLHRAPEPSIGSMIDAWRSGRFATYPQLPGWIGRPWSMLLTPGWKDLIGCSSAEIASTQWARTTETLLDDLESLAPDRWCSVRYEDVVADPDTVVGALARWLGFDWDRPVVGPLPHSSTTLEAPRSDKWRRHENAIMAVRKRFADSADRAERVAAGTTPAQRPAAQVTRTPMPVRAPVTFESVSTSSVGELLAKAGSSLIATTYQAGRVVLARASAEGAINTHLKAFPRPMGVAVDGPRLALGTDRSIWTFENNSLLAARLPDGALDACFVPRRSTITGDVAVHEMAWVGDELWFVNTRFSCLATLDERASFQPRWRPSFVTELAAEDRCHLNGLALVDGRPRYVTAMGMTDERQGWREGKIGGGVVIDVDDNSIVAHNLTMPHSPRWHRGELYVLNSGEGTLCRVDLMTGRAEEIVRLPGFTRGLAFIGRYAIVGLSKVREHIFAGLPLARHVEDRKCGLWLVDLETAANVGFLSFEGSVDEIFDVQVLPGMRRPELLEPADQLVSSSFNLFAGPAAEQRSVS